VYKHTLKELKKNTDGVEGLGTRL